MKIYKNRGSLIFQFMMICVPILVFTSVIVNVYTGKFPIIALPGLITSIIAYAALMNTQKCMAIDDNILNILDHKGDIIDSYSIGSIDKVLFEKVFLNGYRVGIKRGRQLKVYSLSRVGTKEINILKQDLEQLGIKYI